MFRVGNKGANGGAVRPRGSGETNARGAEYSLVNYRGCPRHLCRAACLPAVFAGNPPGIPSGRIQPGKAYIGMSKLDIRV